MSNTDAAPRKATLDDLCVKTFVFEIVSPFGDVLTVEFDDISPARALEIDQLLGPLPARQASSFTKDKDGQVKPVYDDNDPAYLRAMSDRYRRLNALLVAESAHMEFPGDSLQERAEWINSEALATWARRGLFEAVDMMRGAGRDVSLHKPFQPGAPVDAEGM